MEAKPEAEKKEFKLFREKSLEAVESPESLNDYLRVTSPGVWLILAAIIALLVGAILWGVFGRIRTTDRVAVAVSAEKSVCYVAFDDIDQVMGHRILTVNGTEYQLDTDADLEFTVVSEEFSPRLLLAGGLNVGDLVVEVPVMGELAEGYHTGEVVTEDLQPISLLLR